MIVSWREGLASTVKGKDPVMGGRFIPTTLSFLLFRPEPFWCLTLQTQPRHGPCLCTFEEVLRVPTDSAHKASWLPHFRHSISLALSRFLSSSLSLAVIGSPLSLFLCIIL